MNNTCHIHRRSIKIAPPPGKLKYIIEEGVTNIHSPEKESVSYV